MKAAAPEAQTAQKREKVTRPSASQQGDRKSGGRFPKETLKFSGSTEEKTGPKARTATQMSSG